MGLAEVKRILPLHGNIEMICRIVHVWGRSFNVYARLENGAEVEVDLGVSPIEMKEALRNHGSLLQHLLVPVLIGARGAEFDSGDISGQRTTVWFIKGYNPQATD